MIHADLRIFHLIEDNGINFVNMLKEIVGNEGTLITPSFTFSFPDDFDLQKSMSNIGALTTLFSKDQSVQRVPDGMTSYYLTGKHAGVMIDKWQNSSYGKNSICDQLINNSGKILQIGTDILSMIHYVEEYVKVPYRKNKRFNGNIIDNGLSTKSHTYFYARIKDVKKKIPDPIRASFFSKLNNVVNVENKQVRLFSARRFLDFAAPRLAMNNQILVTQKG
jgi:aminoglycoside 3-N-acetyltransferase